MRVESDGNTTSLNVPFEEGVNVRVQGSNIEFTEYHDLLRAAVRSVGVTGHFDEPHDSSTVTQAERYVRVDEDYSGPVHARDGPLARMGHLLEADRDGKREIEQTDVAEDGETVPGYRHQVGLDERRVQKIHPDHRLPKRVKHYRARQSHSLDSDHPLRHPKVGAIYYGSLWRDTDQSLGVGQLEELTDELEETLLSVLHDAGLDVTSTGQYVADDYFQATTSDRDRQVVDLPLEDIEQRQENVVISHLYDGLSPIQEQALETLVTDGGQVSPADVADEGDFHLRSVYRALDEMGELVQHEYDSLSLQSTYVGELVHTAVTEAREAVEKAVGATAKAARAERRGLDEHTSALVAWAERYVDNFREAPDGIVVNVGTVKASNPDDARRQIRQILRDGADLWCTARDTTKWRLGKWRAVIEVPKHHNLKSVTSGERERRHIGGRLWETAPP